MRPAGVSIGGQRGMTLVELIIAVGISASVILGCCHWIAETIRQMHFYRTQSALTEGSLLLADALLTDVQGAGGGLARAWTSVGVDNDCGASANLPDCNGADRLSYAQIADDLSQCHVLSSNPSKIKFDASVSCCLNPAMQGRQFILTLGENHVSGFARIVDLAKCEIDFKGGQLKRYDFPGLRTDWAGATLTVVVTKTIFFDPRALELRQWIDRNGNDAVDAGETTLLADEVHDFQVALGFDFNPADRIIDEDPLRADEWLHNAPGEALGVGVFAGASRDRLRMIQIALILGARATGAERGASASLRAFDGPERNVPGLALRAQRAKLLLRNMQRL